MNSSSNDNAFRLPTLDEIKKRQLEKQLKIQLSSQDPELDPVASALLENARLEATKIIDEALASADAQAQQIIEQAHADSEDIYESARQRAYSDAQTQAHKELLIAVASLDDGYRNAIERLSAQGGELFSQLKGHIVDTILQIANKVLFTEFDKNDEVFINMINGAISSINEKDTIILHVSPWEHSRFFVDSNHYSVLKENFPNIEILKDSNLEKGCFEIVSGSTTLTAGVKKQLDRLGYSLHYLKGE